jgi:hypothetical protein
LGTPKYQVESWLKGAMGNNALKKRTVDEWYNMFEMVEQRLKMRLGLEDKKPPQMTNKKIKCGNCWRCSGPGPLLNWHAFLEFQRKVLEKF